MEGTWIAARRWSRWIEAHPWLSYAIFFLTTGFLYTLATKYPLYAPYVVEPTSLDYLIPLVPWSVPIYMSYFLVVPVFIVLFREHSGFGAAFLTIGLCVAIHLSIVNLFPSSVAPAEAWNRQSHWLTALLESGDTRLAAFPSGHVALPVCTALLVRRIASAQAPRLFYAVWAASISIATLTTKQHYLPDIVGGLIWGVGVVGLGARFFGVPQRAQ